MLYFHEDHDYHPHEPPHQVSVGGGGRGGLEGEGGGVGAEEDQEEGEGRHVQVPVSSQKLSQKFFTSQNHVQQSFFRERNSREKGYSTGYIKLPCDRLACEVQTLIDNIHTLGAIK